jgi:hypothetical protein
MICEVCQKSFARKETLKNHLLSYKHIVHDPSKNLLTCHCGKNYSHRQSLHRHKTKCAFTLKSEQKFEERIEEIERVNRELQLQILEKDKHDKELKEQIGNLLDRLGSSSKIENKIIENNIENVENQTNITINYFGNENLDYITNKVLISCIGKVYGSIQALVETIHFHPDHPENHNIKITNKKLQHAQVMNRDKKWKLVHRNQVIEQLMDKSYQLLEDSFAENKAVIPLKKKENFQHFKQKYEDDDKEVKRQIKNDVDLLVLNGRSQLYPNQI